LYERINTLKAVPLISCSNTSRINWLKTKPILQNGEIHIHCFYLNENQLLLPALSYLLNADEKSKASKYHQTEDANMYRLGRMAVKRLLSLYNNCPLNQIQIISRKGQKPFWNILPGNIFPAVCFNLSHSQNILLLAVSKNEVGVDVEAISRYMYEDVMQKAFTGNEINFVKTSPDALQAFYTIWTRKEALLKTAGVGLIDDLPQLEVLNGNNTTTLNAFKNKDYHVCSFLVNESHIGSIGYEAAPDKEIKFFNTSLSQFA
jgi:Phosphopantetheinyl transferase